MSNPAPILVALPFHAGDLELAKNLLQWLTELGDHKPHSLVLVVDSAVPVDRVKELAAIATPIFNEVRAIIVTVPAPEGGKTVWPPNVMFLNAARNIQMNYKLPFFWLEPDCVPLVPDWLDALAEDYTECPKRFMGALVQQEGQAGMPAVHLTGCSLYPNDAWGVIASVDSVKNGTQAWDIGAADKVVPRSANTKLIHHFWGTKELPPVFVSDRTPTSPKNHVLVSFVNPEAVLFHRSKDGALINLLRAKRGITPKGIEIDTPPAELNEPPAQEMTFTAPESKLPPAPVTTPHADLKKETAKQPPAPAKART